MAPGAIVRTNSVAGCNPPSQHQPSAITAPESARVPGSLLCVGGVDVDTRQGTIGSIPYCNHIIAGARSGKPRMGDLSGSKQVKFLPDAFLVAPVAQLVEHIGRPSPWPATESCGVAGSYPAGGVTYCAHRFGCRFARKNGMGRSIPIQVGGLLGLSRSAWTGKRQIVRATSVATSRPATRFRRGRRFLSRFA